jgi:copper resistance protein D
VAEALILSRLLQFAAVFVVFGCGAFRLYGLGVDTATTSVNALATFDAWFWRVTIVGTIVVLVSALSLLLATTAAMVGSAPAALDLGTISKVLFGTSFGRVWCWHLVFTILAIGVCIAPRTHWRMPAILVLSFLLLVSLGWVGHAVEGQGKVRLAHQINQMVHLLAAGLWLGGLFPLAWLLGRARSSSGTAWISVARGVVPRFSQMGYAAVALLAATGALNTLLLVGSTQALVGTPYGRLLGLKILLFLAMVAVALFNRFRLLPRLRRDTRTSAATATLARSVLCEQGLGFAVLAVVSVLGTWPPTIHPGGHQSGGADLVIPHHPIDRERGEPTRHKDPDDEVSECSEVAGCKVDGVPYATGETELFRDQPQGFDRADNHGDDDRDAGDRQIIVELAERVYERPAISADHQDAVARIDERHAGGEQRREHQDRPDR